MRLFAAARAAAGVATCDLPACSARDADALRAALLEALWRPPGLEAVLARCTLLVDGRSVPPTSGDVPVPPGAQVDVLPPFAGG